MSFNSKLYWENRYKNGGNSGWGSYDEEHTKFKANYVNSLIIDNNIKSIIEFGCGDGNQLAMFNGYESYTGYDVSDTIINKCKSYFNGDQSKFFTSNLSELKPKYDLALSLDVVYHLVEEIIYLNYLDKLFKTADIVSIYTTNIVSDTGVSHISLRSLDNYMKKNQVNFDLVNKSLWPGKNPHNTGFYTYKRIKNDNV